jgi:hypothetical protein
MPEAEDKILEFIVSALLKSASAENDNGALRCQRFSRWHRWTGSGVHRRNNSLSAPFAMLEDASLAVASRNRISGGADSSQAHDDHTNLSTRDGAE